MIKIANKDVCCSGSCGTDNPGNALPRIPDLPFQEGILGTSLVRHWSNAVRPDAIWSRKSGIVWYSAYSLTSILMCKAKRQYLLTLQVSRYCLLTLLISTAALYILSAGSHLSTISQRYVTVFCRLCNGISRRDMYEWAAEVAGTHHGDIIPPTIQSILHRTTGLN